MIEESFTSVAALWNGLRRQKKAMFFGEIILTDETNERYRFEGVWQVMLKSTGWEIYRREFVSSNRGGRHEWVLISTPMPAEEFVSATGRIGVLPEETIKRKKESA
jgi:hypothetical protein